MKNSTQVDLWCCGGRTQNLGTSVWFFQRNQRQIPLKSNMPLNQNTTHPMWIQNFCGINSFTAEIRMTQNDTFDLLALAFGFSLLYIPKEAGGGGVFGCWEGILLHWLATAGHRRHHTFLWRTHRGGYGHWQGQTLLEWSPARWRRFRTNGFTPITILKERNVHPTLKRRQSSTHDDSRLLIFSSSSAHLCSFPRGT